jgi:hypothetical protein
MYACMYTYIIICMHACIDIYNIDVCMQEEERAVEEIQKAEYVAYRRGGGG